jgi:hypothetical protein
VRSTPALAASKSRFTGRHGAVSREPALCEETLIFGQAKGKSLNQVQSPVGNWWPGATDYASVTWCSSQQRIPRSRM